MRSGPVECSERRPLAPATEALAAKRPPLSVPSDRMCSIGELEMAAKRSGAANHWLGLAAVLLALTRFGQASASIAMENVDIDLARIAPRHLELKRNTSAVELMNVAESRSSAESAQPANKVPVYRSAPKQISALDEVRVSHAGSGGQLQDSAPSEPKVGRGPKRQLAVPPAGSDLSRAAAGHYKRKQHEGAQTKKQAVKVIKTVAIKAKVKRGPPVRRQHGKSYGPSRMHHHQHQQHEAPGHYYE